jgi:protein-tyrosine-phosphatase
VVAVAASAARRAEIHAALAEPVRVAIVDELRNSDRSPSDLARSLELPGNLLAHHLDVLERAAVIDRSASRGDRRRRYVHLKSDTLDEIRVPDGAYRGPVLFVCTHNAARSPLAAALWRATTGSTADSAGTHPADRVHPLAVEAGRRAGLDLGSEVPRGLTPADDRAPLTITVCDRAHEELDSPAGWLHWSVPDPSESDDPTAFDHAVDELDRRVHALAS